MINRTLSKLRINHLSCNNFAISSKVNLQTEMGLIKVLQSQEKKGISIVKNVKIHLKIFHKYFSQANNAVTDRKISVNKNV